MVTDFKQLIIPTIDKNLQQPRKPLLHLYLYTTVFEPASLTIYQNYIPVIDSNPESFYMYVDHKLNIIILYTF